MNSNHANYVKIIGTIVIAVVAIIVVLVAIGGLGAGGGELLAETYYEKSVSGLSVGSAVNFRGVKIGEVKEIAFLGNKYDVKGPANHYVYIKMALDRKLLGYRRGEEVEAVEQIKHLVNLGLRATVSASGVTGLSRVECNIHRDELETSGVKVTWDPKNIYIPSKVSLLDSFSDSATKVMNQINSMDVTTVWSNINGTVSHLAEISSGLNNIIDSRQPELERILVNLEEATSAFRDFAERVKNEPSLILRGGSPSRLDETR